MMDCYFFCVKINENFILPLLCRFADIGVKYTFTVTGTTDNHHITL